jgi:exodeoxyribonuclease VII small subunit
MSQTDEKFDFAAGLKQLEEITAWFESEEVDLDKALVKFEQGVELAAKLRQHLQSVENRVEKIKQKFSPGTTTSSAVEPESEPPTEVVTPDLFSE